MVRTRSYIRNESADLLINRRCMFIKKVRSQGWTGKCRNSINETAGETVKDVATAPTAMKVMEVQDSAHSRSGVVKPVFLILVIILLAGFVYKGSTVETVASPREQPPAPKQETALKPTDAPKPVNRSVERREIVRSLNSILASFNSLANNYDNAKAPGNPDKTAGNFRNLQYRADALRKELTNIHIPDKDLSQAASLQHEMLANFSNSCRFYAEYLEGKRKITEDNDWVNEANRLRWRSLTIRSQFAEKLQNIQI